MNSATVQSAMSLPRPITIRWSAVFSISDIRWLDTNTVRPSAASALHQVADPQDALGSSPFTGSSNIRIAGSPSSAAAMPSRWPMPSEKPLRPLPGHAAEADELEHLADPASGQVVGLRQAQQVVVGAAAAVHRLARPAARRPRASGRRAAANGLPLIVTVPAVGRSRPRISRMVVVLPAPFGPRKPVIFPGSTVNDRSSTAVVVAVPLGEASCLDHAGELPLSVNSHWPQQWLSGLAVPRPPVGLQLASLEADHARARTSTNQTPAQAR